MVEKSFTSKKFLFTLSVIYLNLQYKLLLFKSTSDCLDSSKRLKYFAIPINNALSLICRQVPKSNRTL